MMKPFRCLTDPSERRNPNSLQKSRKKNGGGGGGDGKHKAVREASGDGLQILDEDGRWNTTLAAKTFAVTDVSESMDRFDRFRRRSGSNRPAEEEEEDDAALPLIYWTNSFLGSDGGVLDLFDKNVAFAQIAVLENKCLCTKRGWMLFVQPRRSEAGNSRFFLQNISTGAREILPEMSGYRPGNAAIAVTSGAGSLDYVVHVSRDYWQRTTTIHVVRLGDEAWQTYPTTTPYPYRCTTMYAAVIAKGIQIYCFDYDGDHIAVFNLVDRVWSHTQCSGDCGGRRFHVTEVGDEIVRMSVPGAYFEPYIFCKLRVCWEEKSAEWVEMGEGEWRGRSYFVDGNGAFSTTSAGGGEVVYQFGSPEVLPEAVSSRVPEGKLIKKIEAYDLNDCVKRDLLGCCLLADGEPMWINL